MGKPYKKTNPDEIKAFLGINLLMGIKRYPSYRDYWSTAPDLHDPYISLIMTLHRFGWLLSHVHLNDNSVIPARDTINFDKLYKVRPFLDSLKANFRNCLQPHENVAVDESMIKFKGRISIKQYMPKKPIKRGYKVWMLADSSGYFLNFEIYTGKAGNEVEQNLGARVVKNMTSEIANKNHKVFFDNFFTGVPLMEELRQQHLYACGTVNSTRKNLPQFKTDKELKRGDFDWYSSNTGLAAIKWRDRRSVHLLSYYHNPSSSTAVKRKEKDGTQVQVPCPIMLRDYNKNMNFVDKFDQLRATYGIDRKSHKWWHRIFFFFIDSALVNAFIINNFLGKSPQLTIKNFRRQVSEGLVSNNLVNHLSLPTDLSLPLKKHKPSV
ncbi:piggyBac transposable element-derived protein 4-like [Sitophilus oryzae]|uniref:PiggyBac transposable element-derived protein 4-like n=1 Tax=Sitophilus oryzae TaxID=7048 RepID=A0A6J2XJB0_SITOR|nr:piggyBac transposable element-derived protein 4-like [Sitophilus oryzae]